MGSFDTKMDAPMDLVMKPLASQKISIPFSTGTGNGFVSGAMDIPYSTSLLAQVIPMVHLPLNHDKDFFGYHAVKH